MMTVLSFSCILWRDYANPVILSLVLLYSMKIQDILIWVLRLFILFKAKMVNADRCLNVLSIPQEHTDKDQRIEVPAGWPQDGEIEFQGVELKYRPNTALVLKDLNFKVQAG